MASALAMLVRTNDQPKAVAVDATDHASASKCVIAWAYVREDKAWKRVPNGAVLPPDQVLATLVGFGVLGEVDDDFAPSSIMLRRTDPFPPPPPPPPGDFANFQAIATVLREANWPWSA